MKTASKFSSKDFLQSFDKGLQSLAEAIECFMVQFKDASNSWKDLQRSDRAKNQLLITLIGVILTLILNLVRGLL